MGRRQDVMSLAPPGGEAILGEPARPPLRFARGTGGSCDTGKERQPLPGSPPPTPFGRRKSSSAQTEGS